MRHIKDTLKIFIPVAMIATGTFYINTPKPRNVETSTPITSPATPPQEIRNCDDWICRRIITGIVVK